MVANSGKGDFESRLALEIMERDTGHQDGSLNPFVGVRDYDESSNLDSLVDGVCFESEEGSPYQSRSIFIEDIVREDRRNSGASSHSQNCTYKPAITAKATALPARSFEEMSIGDSRRREVAVRKVLAQNAKKEEISLTLRPRLTRMAVKSPSHLRLHDADNYTVMRR